MIITLTTTTASGAQALAGGQPGPQGPAGTPGIASPITLGINTQTSASYTFQSSDVAKTVIFTFSGVITGTLPTFTAGWWCIAKVTGTGSLVLSPSVGLIDGQSASPTIPAGKSVLVWFDGSNFQTTGMIPNAVGYAGGRLSLSSSAVMTANATAQTVINYIPYVHNQISIFNGTYTAAFPFAQSSITLDAANVLSGNVYDVFIALNNAGAPVIGYGPAWTNTTTRSAATALTQSVGGMQTNNLQITLRINSSTTFIVPANQATYLGTFYATANGQTGMLFTASAGGGGGNILGLWNAYNQAPIMAYSIDSTSSWTYNSATWRKANNNANNSIGYIDGLGTSFIDALYSNAIQTSSTVGGSSGLHRDWASGTPTFLGSMFNVNASSITTQTPAEGAFLPSMGFHTINALENVITPGTATYAATNTGVPILKIQLPM